MVKLNKKILPLAALVVISALNIGMANAADVSSWADINTNKDAESINFQSDITATGEEFPSPITFTSATDQTIDGNYHSFSSQGKWIDQDTDPRWIDYSLSISKTGGSLSLKNLGKFSDGNADNNTFSYTDLDGNTVYNNIEASVNNWKGYFLTINKPINVNITNSVFANNGKDRDARLIYVSSSGSATLNVKDSIFYNNEMANAGPVVNSGKFDLNVENSVFYGNKQVRHTSSVAGGALSSENGKVTVKNSYFINNAVKNVAFPDDATFGKGGAIYIENGSGHTIENSRFEGNTSVEEGGAVYTNFKATVDYVKNSQFIGNKQTSTHSGTSTMYGGGGGLSIGGGYIRTIDNVLFDNNSSANKGGGLYLEELSLRPSSNKVALVKDTTFKNNTAELGGGMYFSSDNAKYATRIVDPEFTSNTATRGGGLYINNGDTAIISEAKDVVFSGNTATDTSVSNAGDDVYFITKSYGATLSLNAAENKKVVFNGTIATSQTGTNVPVIDINKGGITYSTYVGETETVHNAGTGGEIQFNNHVGDSNGNISNINLYGGKLSIGQNDTNNANTTNPDGYINDNNFYVKGNSILNTVNYVIGEFAPKTFDIDAALDYQFDVDLVNAKSDTIKVTNNNGTLNLSLFNVISDTDSDGLEIKYSDTNVNGVVKDDYDITTSEKTYEVTAKNVSDGSYIVFSSTDAGGGLANAIANESDQYIITNNKDEKVTAWAGNNQNNITSDIDINANNNSIYTENALDGMVVSDGVTAVLRNVKELSGFNNALTNNGGTLSIVDSNITNNTGDADVTNNSGAVIIDAQTKDVVIGSDNTDNALVSDGGTVDVKGSNKVTFNGNVTGSNGAQMNVSTDTDFNGNVSGMNVDQTSGTVNVNDFAGGDYTLDDGTLNLGESGSFAPDTFALNNGTVNIANESAFSPQSNIFSGGNINAINNNVGSLNFNSLTLKNAINLAVDIDLNKEVMDTISASSITGNGIIKVNEFNVLSDSSKSRFSIPFANGKLKDRVSTDITTLEGKIYKYKIAYDSETGKFNIIGGGSHSDGYSPAVMASPIAAQLQGYLTQLNSYDEAFRNMDMYMLLPYRVRQAMKYKNRVAISSAEPVYDSEKTIYDDNTGWVRTHTTFEKVPLKNGPKVKNIAYGAYFGGESELYDLGHGWDGMWGLYAGYNGSHQNYNGISMYQNGGTLGVLGMAYKGNFFQGLTINTGANGGEANTRFGNDDFAMLMAGIASKTGYNFELKEGKFIIQPSLLLSYSFVNSFDYTNSEGVRISSDPLHAIQIEPNVKFIANLKNSWQPYASVGMVWNIMDKTHYMANDVSLPELSVKPYVKYGVGIRKSWGERFTGFFQTFITNGGRNGVGIQLGFRWALGGKKLENSVLDTSKPIKNRKIVKSL